MATINSYTGDGSTTLYSLTFEYLDETDVKVKIDGTLTSAYSFANATQLLFDTAPANGAEILIYRNTDVSEPIVSFFAGSSIRAQDLNSASDQVRFSVEEWRDQTVPLYGAVLPDDIDMGTNQINNLGEPTSAQDAATKNYVDTTTWNVTDETLQSGETWISDDNHVATTAAMDARFQDEAQETILSTETWISDDDHIATTAALDARFQDELSETITSAEVWPDNDATIATTAAIDNRIDTAITNDIGTDGTGITVTDDGDGTITLGLGAGSIDIDRIKAGDIITYAEQNAGSPAWESDDQLATTWAAAKRFDTIVQTATPTGSDWQIGKTWLQNDSNKTLSIWNGSTWLGIASGGTFTTQPSVIYVDSVNGDDANDGHRIITPKATIKDAVADANDGDIIIVAPGTYQETLPIDITVNNLSIVGSSQRSCFIIPAVGDEEEIMFRCNSGTYIDGFTFTGLKASGTRGNNALDDDPTYGLPENQGWVAGFYPGCTILKSPYINNCTSYMDSAVDVSDFDPNNPAGTGGDTTSDMTGGGILVDGSVPATSSPLRSFVVNEFTQVNLDGPGMLVTNNGYAQAVSFFALFCHYHAKALNGGQINMEVGTTDFGRYGLIADGKSSSTIFTATADGAASTGATSFLINAPTASAGWFGSATRPANTMLVEVGGNIYPILSSSANGSGWSVVVSNPDTNNRNVNNGLVNGHSSGATVNFYLRSQISAAAHTFEYAGSGVNYSALPQNGGVANESNQVVQTGAAAIAGNQTEGAVFYSSTDENGKFKVGDTFQVDQKTGFVTIDPQSYSTNLVSDLTPQLGGDMDVQTFDITTSTTNGDIVITPNGTGNVVLDGLRYPEADGTAGQTLQTDGAGNLTFQDTVLGDPSPQLSADLDVQTNAITTSTVDGDIDINANGAGLIQATEFNLAQVPIVTQHDIGTAANEVPLNGMLGGMAFQDPASVSVDNLEVTNQITGNLAFASGNGIDFSADSNAAGMTSELLDDYEEGTWTPDLTPASGSFTSIGWAPRFGWYTKIGNRVWVTAQWNIDGITVGTASGTLTVTGLPFQASGGRNWTAGVGYSRDFVNAPIGAAIFNGNSHFILVRSAGATGTSTLLTVADLNTGAPNKNELGFTVCYQIA